LICRTANFSSAKFMELMLCFSDFGSKSSSLSCIDDTASGSYDRAKASVSLKVFWYVEGPSVVSSRARTGAGICIEKHVGVDEGE
jgi:hypothetical protein